MQSFIIDNPFYVEIDEDDFAFVCYVHRLQAFQIKVVKNYSDTQVVVYIILSDKEYEWITLYANLVGKCLSNIQWSQNSKMDKELADLVVNCFIQKYLAEKYQIVRK